jgi:DNA-directed RNA polymerase specialized sigma24 family protein
MSLGCRTPEGLRGLIGHEDGCGMTLDDDRSVSTSGRENSGDAWFEAFERNRVPRLKVALIAAFGVDTGAEAGADVVAYAWEHRIRLSTMENPAGYLFRVGQTTARRHRRWQKAPPPPAVTASLTVEIDPDLPRALAALSARQRTSVVLVHVNGWTLEEAAIAMGVSIPTVRTHLARGIGRLQRLLKDNEQI